MSLSYQCTLALYNDITRIRYNFLLDVCIDRKVINEDGEEEAPLDEEEDLNDGGQERSRRHGKFMRMDMSFTTCRDDHNYHECTTQMSRNGETKKVTVRHQCCYGFERSSDGSIGCTKVRFFFEMSFSNVINRSLPLSKYPFIGKNFGGILARVLLKLHII